MFNTVPGFTLTAESGDDFRSADKLAGKVWVANFIYTTCPGPCPRTTRQMSLVQSGLEGVADARLVSFTVDPDNDSPSSLAAYAKRHGAVPGRWTFLTGDKKLLDSLARETFMLHAVDGKNADHSTRLVLVDRKGRVRKYYDTVESTAIDHVVADAKDLAREPG
jgi:protein SCO1/2